MSGVLTVDPGRYSAEELRAAFQQRTFEVRPLEDGFETKWVKASTAGHAVERWAEDADVKPRLGRSSCATIFERPILVAVCPVLDDGVTRGEVKRYRVEARFTRRYDVLEARS